LGFGGFSCLFKDLYLPVAIAAAIKQPNANRATMPEKSESLEIGKTIKNKTAVVIHKTTAFFGEATFGRGDGFSSLVIAVGWGT
jgi:hypothetical protein